MNQMKQRHPIANKYADNKLFHKGINSIYLFHILAFMK